MLWECLLQLYWLLFHCWMVFSAEQNCLHLIYWFINYFCFIFSLNGPDLRNLCLFTSIQDVLFILPVTLFSCLSHLDFWFTCNNFGVWSNVGANTHFSSWVSAILYWKVNTFPVELPFCLCHKSDYIHIHICFQITNNIILNVINDSKISFMGVNLGFVKSQNLFEPVSRNATYEQTGQKLKMRKYLNCQINFLCGI